jgi:hypothetical protein
MLIRTLAAAAGLSALVAGLGGAAPPAAAHLLFDTERPPYCTGCAGEYLRWRRIFERTKPWRVYQRELRETIPLIPPDRNYYGVRSYFHPGPDYFPR